MGSRDWCSNFRQPRVADPTYRREAETFFGCMTRCVDYHCLQTIDGTASASEWTSTAPLRYMLLLIMNKIRINNFNWRLHQMLGIDTASPSNQTLVRLNGKSNFHPSCFTMLAQLNQLIPCYGISSQLMDNMTKVSFLRSEPTVEFRGLNWRSWILNDMI